VAISVGRTRKRVNVTRLKPEFHITKLSFQKLWR